MNGSHDAHEQAEGQAGPNQRWRVEEEAPQNAEVAAEEPKGMRNAERHPEPSEAAEPSCSDAGALTSCLSRNQGRDQRSPAGSSQSLEHTAFVCSFARLRLTSVTP